MTTGSPSSMNAMALGDRFVQSREQISTTHQETYLILSLAGNDYFSLDAVGAYVWSLLKEPRSLADLIERVLERYRIDRDTCQRDLGRLLGALQHEHLISAC